MDSGFVVVEFFEEVGVAGCVGKDAHEVEGVGVEEDCIVKVYSITFYWMILAALALGVLDREGMLNKVC